VQDSKLNALAVTTPERSASAPEIPTMRESAPELAKFDVSSWFGVFLPKSAPPPIVDALNTQIKLMLARDDIKKNIASMGARSITARHSRFPISSRRGLRSSPASSSRKICRWT
jgi:tripartite-type tricarboxylate transporter receptor subunit TctC